MYRPSRVVMVTAHGTREVIAKANEAGAQTVVLKPFTPAELAEGVARAASETLPEDSTDVSAQDVARWASDAGFLCRSQELVRSGTLYLTDCFSVITRPGSRWARPATTVTKNRRFMQEIAQIASR